MPRAQRSPRYAWIEENQSARRDSFAQAVEDGLGSKPFSLPCRFFYDAVGSRLFEAICELPEYYLTRAEHEILARSADEIVEHCASPLSLA
jgi:L-histidine Nalpha-methyltransferase